MPESLEKRRTAAVSLNRLRQTLAVRTRVRSIWTRMTYRSRATPDFLCIGFYKAGTTSLYDYLDLHPNVILSWLKEVNYYTVFYERGDPWYRSHFPTRRALRRANAITGEMTPSICSMTEALERVRHDSPRAKLILIVRDPFERTRSLYAMMQQKGVMKHSFEQALALADSVASGATLTDPSEIASLEFLERFTVQSLYADSIQRTIDHSDGHFLVLFLETLFSDGGESIEKLSSFLSIPYIPTLSVPHSNRGGYRREQVKESATIESMHRRFDQSNAELNRLLRSPRVITTDPSAWPEWLADAGDTIEPGSH